jgi:hypothetical protein
MNICSQASSSVAALHLLSAKVKTNIIALNAEIKYAHNCLSSFFLKKWFFFCLVCRHEDRLKLETEVKKADAIVLTYACDQPQTLERLSSHWLPELRQLEVCFSSLF